MFQANLLVAMLGGFWARKADGHSGPDLLGRGLVLLNGLVEWERMKKESARKAPRAREARRKQVNSDRELQPTNIEYESM